MKKRNQMIAAAMAAAICTGAAGPAWAQAVSAKTPAADSATQTAEQMKETQASHALAVTKAPLDLSDPSVPVWKTDIRLGIDREQALIREAGVTIDEWDEALAQMKKEGLSCPITREDIRKADAKTQITEKDGAAVYIGRSAAIAPVHDVLEAYRTAYALMPALGGTEDTDLVIWSRLYMNGGVVYSFQQVNGALEVPGAVVKIAAGETGEVTAVFSSLTQDTAPSEPAVCRQQAEEAVLAHLKDNTEDTQGEAKILPGYTHRMIYNTLTMGQALDISAEPTGEPDPQLLFWVAYTANEDPQEKDAYPFTAHYVSREGEYVFDLPVKEPGSDEAMCGYRKQDVFAGMKADTWTGQITGKDGTTRTVTLPVMRSEEDGRWYLGDVNRRVAVADFAEAAYSEDNNLRLVGSSTNDNWDNEDLYMFCNYIMARDFYADMGWTGPDGEGTDTIILKDLCLRDGTIFENACYVDKIQGWQMFGYAAYGNNGEPLKLARGLDVMAHEFTHCVTSTAMNRNLYENDLGAINEAMSDIMGNLAEYILKETDDTSWKLGENADMVIRSMSDPNAYGQPAHVWDIYYGAHSDEPGEMNDQGGVHTNSSLLNLIAAKLCLQGGMSYPDAAAFWMRTAMGMTPKADYVQMKDLLGWAMEENGNGKGTYREALDGLIRETQIERVNLPEQVPEGRRIVRLSLPETETFEDSNWILLAMQFNAQALKQTAAALAGMVMNDLLMTPDGENAENTDEAAALPANFDRYLKGLKKLFDRIDVDESVLKTDGIKTEDDFFNTLKDAMSGVLGKTILEYTGWREAGTRDITLMMADNPTVYILMNMSNAGTQLNGAAVLMGGHWYDMGKYLLKDGAQQFLTQVSDMADMAEEADGQETLTDEQAQDETAATEEALEDLLQDSETDWGSALEDILDLASQIAINELQDGAEAAIEKALAGEEETKEKTPSDYLLGIADGIMNFLADSALYMDIPEIGEAEQETVMVPADIEYLPDAGLEKVQLYN